MCVSISDFSLDACKKTLKICERYRAIFPDLVSEIRLDLCGLDKKNIYDLFSRCNDINFTVAVAKQFSDDVHIEDALTVAGAYPFTRKKTDFPVKKIDIAVFFKLISCLAQYLWNINTRYNNEKKI